MANRTQLQMILDRIRSKLDEELAAFRASKRPQVDGITKAMKEQRELDLAHATEALKKFAARQGLSTSRDNLVVYPGDYAPLFKMEPCPTYRKLETNLKLVEATCEKGVQEIKTRYQKLIDAITVDGLTPEHKETVKKLLGQ